MVLDSSSEEIDLALEALSEAARRGAPIVGFAGLSERGALYEIENDARGGRFTIEALRRAALALHTPFVLHH